MRTSRGRCSGNTTVSHGDGMGLATLHHGVDAVDKAVLCLPKTAQVLHDLGVERVRGIQGSRHVAVKGDLTARGHKRQANARGRAGTAPATNGVQVAKLFLGEAVGLHKTVARVLDEKGATKVLGDVTGQGYLGRGRILAGMRRHSRPHVRSRKRRACQLARLDEPCPIILAQSHGVVPLLASRWLSALVSIGQEAARGRRGTECEPIHIRGTNVYRPARDTASGPNVWRRAGPQRCRPPPPGASRRQAPPYSSSVSSPPPISSSTPSAAGMTSSCFARKGYASLCVLG